MVAPLVFAAGAAGGAQQVGKLSQEVFGFDFVQLIIKMGIYFLVAIIIDKLHFLVTGTANIAATILLAFGINLPTSEPDFITKLFSEQGISGVKYWDIIKFGAMALIVIEMLFYIQTQRNLGGSPSPFTIAIFLLIISTIGIFTIPELIQKIKARVNNPTAGV